jgi:hypothetical protein
MRFGDRMNIGASMISITAIKQVSTILGYLGEHGACLSLLLISVRMILHFFLRMAELAVNTVRTLVKGATIQKVSRPKNHQNIRAEFILVTVDAWIAT